MKNTKLKKLLKGNTIILLILIGAGYSFIIDIIFTLINLIGNDSLINYNKHISGLYSGVSYIYDVIDVGLITPVIEELIFRVLIMKIAKRFLPFKWANILQALIFGITHVNIIQIAYAFFIGLIMGSVYNKYETVYSTILIHMSFNLVGSFFPIFYSSFLCTITDNIFIRNIMLLSIYLIGIILFWKSFIKIKNYNFENEEAL